MCKPITSFRAKVGSPLFREWRFYAVLAINVESDVILYDCQFISGQWARNLTSSVEAFCERTQMEVANA